MERYEIANGEVYNLVRFIVECVVMKNSKVVCTGSYKKCRLLIENEKKITRRA